MGRKNKKGETVFYTVRLGSERKRGWFVHRYHTGYLTWNWHRPKHPISKEEAQAWVEALWAMHKKLAHVTEVTEDCFTFSKPNPAPMKKIRRSRGPNPDPSKRNLAYLRGTAWEALAESCGGVRSLCSTIYISEVTLRRRIRAGQFDGNPYEPTAEDLAAVKTRVTGEVESQGVEEARTLKRRRDITFPDKYLPSAETLVKWASTNEGLERQGLVRSTVLMRDDGRVVAVDSKGNRWQFLLYEYPQNGGRVALGGVWRRP